MRDHITNAALAGVSNPYQMSADLVALERQLQQLRESYQSENIHSTFFKHLPTAQLLERFYDASMANIDTLDNLIGLSVARQFILQSLTLQLTGASPTNAEVNNANIDIQSELLASVLIGELKFNILVSTPSSRIFIRRLPSSTSSKANCYLKYFQHTAWSTLNILSISLLIFKTSLKA